MASQDAELVHLTTDAPLAVITLDSQHNRNGLSRQLVAELFAALEAAEADDDVRVVLVRSAGQVFCSGADLSEATAGGMEEGARRIVGPAAADRRRMSKPVVTRVYGAVRAGGIGIVAASDIVDRRRRRDLRADRGQARPGRRDHLPDRAFPDEPARRGADDAGR